LCGANFLSELHPFASARNAKIKLRFKRIYCRDKEWKVEMAGPELERIVAQSLRQAPPMQAPLMAWPVVCGSAVAERTHALSFSDGVLRVAVPNSGWKAELQGLAPRYLSVINKYTLQPIRRIEFVITPGENPPDNSR
jgi:aspartyl-tRNA(Asn)/glutamyl-tRNA(Gln) amidotransferase subunit C